MTTFHPILPLNGVVYNAGFRADFRTFTLNETAMT
jgi:hypothetical protein